MEFLQKYLDVLVVLVQFFRNNPAIVTWLLYIVVYQTIFIPGDLVLSFFGWAHASNDGTGLIADSKWWYCIFAVAMFILGWEIIKIVGRRYIVWVRR